MALWEYKVISSGKGGFATPALLESHLNQLGKDDWEIIQFVTHPDNPLAFHGLARRSTQRDWTLQAAAEAAARAEVEKLRADLASAAPASPAEAAGVAESAIPAEPEDGFRRPRNTERDLDPAAQDEDDDDWDLPAEEELPTFFDAIRPHMRRNQRGPGHAVSVEFLVKKFGMIESDLLAALKECGFEIPQREDDPPVHIEYDGDLYWLNLNRHRQLFLNTREKPRPVFRTVSGRRVEPEELEPRPEEPPARTEAPGRREDAGRKGRAATPPAAPATPPAPAPAAPPAEGVEEPPAAAAPPPSTGEGWLELIRPLMRRNRRGPGYSGSIGYLARALKRSEAELTAGLASLGLVPPAAPNEKPAFVEIGSLVYWHNKDNRGGIWINGREKKEGRAPGTPPPPGPETAGTAVSESVAAPAPAPVEAAAPEVASAAPAVSPDPDPAEAAPVETPAAPSAAPSPPEVAARGAEGILATVRTLLKVNKRGSGASGEIGYLARTLQTSEPALLQSLTDAGLAVPADSEAKPTFATLEGEILWINRNAKDGSLWVNAKKKPVRKPRAKKPAAIESEG